MRNGYFCWNFPIAAQLGGPLLVAIFGLGVAGCERTNNLESSAALRIGLESAPNSLDPRYATDANASRISALLHCSLMVPDGSGGWASDLATSWSPSPGDPLAWTFELRGDAVFHDGRPVTSADVVATFESVLDPGSVSPKRGALASVASVEAEGPRRVRIRLSQPDAAFFEGASLGILPAEVAAHRRASASGAARGCGPYRFVGTAPDGDLELSAFDRWFGGPTTLAAIRFRVVPDTVMRTLQLRSGDLDLVQNALEPDAVAGLARSAPEVRITTGPYDAYQYLGFNHRHAALADLRVRRAIAYAIDREAIVRHVLVGQAKVASGLLPAHHRDFDGRVLRYDFDPELAKTLLDRAGYTDPDGDGPLPRLRLRYTTSTVELRRRIAEVIAADLAEVGIELSIESYEWGTFFRDIATGNFDLYSLAWVGIRDADLYRVAMHSAMMPPAGNNRGFYSDPRLDRLLEASRGEMDAAKRRALIGRVQKRTARRLPVVPLWWPDNVVAMSARLEGFTPHPSGDLAGLTRSHLRRNVIDPGR